MKTKIILFLAFTFMVNVHLFSQENERYKIRPGKSEWNSLTTEEERFAALQISEERLKSIDTKELVKLCLDYPANCYITAFNDVQIAMSILFTKFNGFKELDLRDDAGKELIQIYKNMNTKGYNIKNFDCDEQYWTIKFNYVEILLAQDWILNKLTESQIKQLLKISMDKVKMKSEDASFSSLYGLQSSAFVMARTMKKTDNENFKEKASQSQSLSKLCKSGELDDVNTILLIQDEIVKYLK
jgi:hypothetical protein